MPNRKAKDNKKKKALLNKKWATEGRTANQHKKWLAKQAEKGTQYRYTDETGELTGLFYSDRERFIKGKYETLIRLLK